MYHRLISWACDHYWIMYCFEFGLILILVMYGLISADGFSARGY